MQSRKDEADSHAELTALDSIKRRSRAPYSLGEGLAGFSKRVSARALDVTSYPRQRVLCPSLGIRVDVIHSGRYTKRTLMVRLKNS